MRVLFFLFICSITLFSDEVYSELASQERLQSRLRISYEQLPLPQKESMGIIGTHVDFFPFESFKPLYMGLGFYSSLSGKEGGFFAYGYSLGVRYPLTERLYLDTGAYLGGGAGDYIGFDGGGTVLHSHAAVEYEIDNISLVCGVARTDFPGSSADPKDATDIHPYIGVNIQSGIWYESEGAKSAAAKRFDGLLSDLRITPAVIYYDIDAKSVKRADKFAPGARIQKNFPLLGIQLDKFITDDLFVSFEGYGALSSAAGYAALHAGIGYDMKLSDALVWESKFVAGSAGDSRIDTGGGLILQPLTGLRYVISPGWSLKGLAGRTYAPTGLFSATTYEFGLSWQAKTPDTKGGNYLFESEIFELKHWSMSPSIKLYAPYNSSHKPTPQESKEQVGLVGITFAAPLYEWLDLVASTHWAATGNVGEYAEGMMGARVLTPHMSPLKIRLYIDGEIGAGAGDGINESGGYIAQLLAGAKLPITKRTALSLAYGKMKGSGGDFSADTAMFSIDISMGLFKRR